MHDTAGRSVNSSSCDWNTPQKYVNAVKEVLERIDLDPCSNAGSIVGATVAYQLPERDGLTESWDYPCIFVNPPYGSDRVRGTSIRDWLGRCADAHQRHGSEVLALVPVATNTSHWKRHVFGRATAIAFLYDTRLKFLIDGSEVGKGAPMACAMIYWGPRTAEFARVFGRFGAVAMGVIRGYPEGESDS